MSDDDANFIRDVGYFFLERGDPTRSSTWDEARCQRLLPSFYEAWQKSRMYEEWATLSLKAELQKVDQ